MRKHKEAHIFVNSGDRCEFRIWWEESHTLVRTEAGYSSAVTGLLENITERARDNPQEDQHWCDWQLCRENVSQHLKHCSSNKTFQISLLLFMRKLAFLSTWCSHHSHITFLFIYFFGCKEQSIVLFCVLILIKPCCWQINYKQFGLRQCDECWQNVWVLQINPKEIFELPQRLADRTQPMARFLADIYSQSEHRKWDDVWCYLKWKCRKEI